MPPSPDERREALTKRVRGILARAELVGGEGWLPRVATQVVDAAYDAARSGEAEGGMRETLNAALYALQWITDHPGVHLEAAVQRTADKAAQAILVALSEHREPRRYSAEPDGREAVSADDLARAIDGVPAEHLETGEREARRCEDQTPGGQRCTRPYRHLDHHRYSSAEPLQDGGEREAMPVFTIKAKDNLALGAVAAYRRLCNEHGLTEQGAEVAKAIDEISDWRARHPDRWKMPDDKHVPAPIEQAPDEDAIALWRPDAQHPWREWVSDGEEPHGEMLDFVPLAVARRDFALARHPHQDVEPERRWKLKRAKSRNRDHKRRRAAERRAETAEQEVERLREALDSLRDGAAEAMHDPEGIGALWAQGVYNKCDAALASSPDEGGERNG